MLASAAAAMRPRETHTLSGTGMDHGCCCLFRRLAGALDPKALAVLASAAAAMRGEIAAWTARASKHAGPGYALVTMLLCLEEPGSFGAYVDTLVDHLHRGLKVCCWRSATVNLTPLSL